MKKINIIIAAVFLVVGFQQVNSQSIAKGLGMYIFPSEGQDQATQDADESACYKWAIQQTGYDPLNPPTVHAAQVDQSADGSAVRGAARGAAGGAAIGAILGGVRGRRAKKQQDAAQQNANNQAAVNKSSELEADYKKAFAVCMEGKGYTIK